MHFFLLLKILDYFFLKKENWVSDVLFCVHQAQLWNFITLETKLIVLFYSIAWHWLIDVVCILQRGAKKNTVVCFNSISDQLIEIKNKYGFNDDDSESGRWATSGWYDDWRWAGQLKCNPLNVQKLTIQLKLNHFFTVWEKCIRVSKPSQNAVPQTGTTLST